MDKLWTSLFFVFGLLLNAKGLTSLKDSDATNGCKCGPGKFVIISCTNTSPAVCESCEKNKFSRFTDKSESCQDCTVCPGGSQEIQSCTPENDTKCACPVGTKPHPDGTKPGGETFHYCLPNPEPTRASTTVQADQTSPKSESSDKGFCTDGNFCNKTAGQCQRISEIITTPRVPATRPQTDNGSSVVWSIDIVIWLVFVGIFIF